MCYYRYRRHSSARKQLINDCIITNSATTSSTIGLSIRLLPLLLVFFKITTTITMLKHSFPFLLLLHHHLFFPLSVYSDGNHPGLC